MKATHTPGPWVVLPAYTGTSTFPIGHARGDGAHDILGEFNGTGGTVEETTVNARLAASAPNLLAALENAANVLAALATGQLSKVERDSPALIMARAALANAKGVSL
jgi:hypothetical protein